MCRLIILYVHFKLSCKTISISNLLLFTQKLSSLIKLVITKDWNQNISKEGVIQRFYSKYVLSVNPPPLSPLNIIIRINIEKFKMLWFVHLVGTSKFRVLRRKNLKIYFCSKFYHQNRSIHFGCGAFHR